MMAELGGREGDDDESGGRVLGSGWGSPDPPCGLWRLQQQRWEGEGLVAVAASDDDGDNEDGSELGFRDFYFFFDFFFLQSDNSRDRM